MSDSDDGVSEDDYDSDELEKLRQTIETLTKHVSTIKKRSRHRRKRTNNRDRY
jgi:hypothetical protein